MAAKICLVVLAVAMCVCVEAGLTVFGNCQQGAQCAGRPLVSGHAVCCPGLQERPAQVSVLFQFGSTTYLQCRCPVAGDSGLRVAGSCWQGSQCNDCAHTSSYNGQWVCCPHCAASGITFINGRCSC